MKCWEEFHFLGYYVAYVACLGRASAQHDALPLFSKAMMGFVAPITALAILVTAAREWPSRRRRREL